MPVEEAGRRVADVRREQMLAAAAAADRRARLLRHPDRRRGRPGRGQPGAGHLLLRHQGQPAHRGAALVGGARSTPRVEAMLPGPPALRTRLETLVEWTLCRTSRRAARRLGAVVRPVGPGLPAPRGQEGPGRHWTSSGATSSPGWCRPGSTPARSEGRRGGVQRSCGRPCSTAWSCRWRSRTRVVDGARRPLAGELDIATRELGLP